MQAWTSAGEVGVRSPLAPGPAVAERRATDVLPSGHVAHPHGAAAWTMALVASIARTGWLPAVVTLAFLAGAFGAVSVGGGSVAKAVWWILGGGGVWLVLAFTGTILFRNR